MAVMSHDPDPGERRLDRPPSERYAAPPAAAVPDAVVGSLGRAVGYAAAAAVVGVLLTVLLGGVVALSAGLLVVWAATGNVVGMLTKVGGGLAVEPSRRVAIAVAVTLAGFVLGQVGLWWYAGTEGGVLSPIDYLATTFGVLVPLQAALAAGFAWWGAG